jgi:Zn-dependent protease
VAVEQLREPTDANLLERIALGNVLLGVFNLLPAYPMDGGRVLRSLLGLWKPEDEATRIASGAGQMLAILQSRLANSPKQEIRIAAEEQNKITRLRLEKLLTP